MFEEMYPCVDCSFLVEPGYPHKCGVGRDDRPSVQPLSVTERLWDIEVGVWTVFG